MKTPIITTTPKTPLQAARMGSGISQSDLANAAGLSLRTLQEYEQGRRDIGKAALETALRIARALGVPVESLVVGKGEREEERKEEEEEKGKGMGL